MGGTEQQFCLKWNNHRSTLFSVFDNLLEEESLVDVTLSVGAGSQFIRAHRVILSACSPYFRTLFRSNLLNDKHPVVFMKDVDFDNLKSLVEYMYKGEANVPQNMLASFIKTAESLQVRGLAECATKQLENEGLNSTNPPATDLPPAATSTPTASLASKAEARKEKKRAAAAAAAAAAAQLPTDPNATAAAALAAAAAGQGGILAARLAGNPLFDSTLQEMLLRAQGGGAAGTPPAVSAGMPMPQIPPPMKKPRKSMEPQKQNPLAAPGAFLPPGFPAALPLGAAGLPPLPLPPTLTAAASPNTPAKKSKKNTGNNNTNGGTPGAPNSQGAPPINNNYDSGDDGVLKIDEDGAGSAAGNSGAGAEDGGDGKENIDTEGAGAGAKNNLPPGSGGGGSGNEDDELHQEVDLNNSANGVSTEEEDEEEPIAPQGILNPWTGEPIQLSQLTDPDRSSLDGFSSLMEASLKVRGDLNSTSGSIADISGSGGGEGGTPGKGSNAGDPAQKYACNRCGRSYLHQATLVRHQRYECGITASYPCPMCGRKFKRRDVLKGHMEKCANKSTQAAQAAAAQVIQAGASSASVSPLSITSTSMVSSAQAAAQAAALSAAMSSLRDGAAAAASSAAAAASTPSSPFTGSASLGGVLTPTSVSSAMAAAAQSAIAAAAAAGSVSPFGAPVPTVTPTPPPPTTI